jgi:hypothetical protein
MYTLIGMGKAPGKRGAPRKSLCAVHKEVSADRLLGARGWLEMGRGPKVDPYTPASSFRSRHTRKTSPESSAFPPRNLSRDTS